MILSNNHVLADENRGKVGDAIVQPGRHDGGGPPADVVGQLGRFVRLRRAGVNHVDCAVAALGDGTKLNHTKLGDLGKLLGLAAELVEENVAVSKVGRATGTTQGRVTAFELDNLVVRFDIGELRFDNQIEIEGAGDSPFSDGGDSGSLIVDPECRAVELLFAGGDQGGSNGRGLTYANPLHAALDALKVDLLH